MPVSFGKRVWHPPLLCYDAVHLKVMKTTRSMGEMMSRKSFYIGLIVVMAAYAILISNAKADAGAQSVLRPATPCIAGNQCYRAESLRLRLSLTSITFQRIMGASTSLRQGIR